jgi:hypothetical protein
MHTAATGLHLASSMYTAVLLAQQHTSISSQHGEPVLLSVSKNSWHWAQPEMHVLQDLSTIWVEVTANTQYTVVQR